MADLQQETVPETLTKSLNQMLYSERVKNGDYPDGYLKALEGFEQLGALLDNPKTE